MPEFTSHVTTNAPTSGHARSDAAESPVIPVESPDRELLVTSLYLAAPDPLPGVEWWDALLGGRAIAAVPTAELAGIVANLEAAPPA